MPLSFLSFSEGGPFVNGPKAQCFAREVAMMGKLKYTALRDAVFAHPTLAESLNNLFFHFTDEKN